jgi:hypothetical protein
MPIHLECPNPKCKVKLTVKEHLAGKRVPCPKCKQLIVIPAPVDIEALAAAALGDDGATEKPQTSTIDFTCPFCDEEIHVARSLGGKQTSCPNPECRRIIKVPMPKEEKPDEWRTLKRTGPSGARENVEAPRLEGAWDTARATVSGEALIEAGAIEEEKQPVTAAQWVRGGVAVTSVLLVVVAVTVGVRWYLFFSKVQSLLDQGLAYTADGSKLPPAWKAALERSASGYTFDAGEPEKARKHLMKARAFLTASEPGTERDASLREVALAQTRLREESTREELSRTIKEIGDEDARLLTFREVMGKLLADKRLDVALPLVSQFGVIEQPKEIPPPGQLQQIPDDEGEDAAPKVAVQPAANKKKPGPPPAPVSLIPTQRIALDLFQNKADDAKKVREMPADLKEAPDLIARLGYAEGLARQDKYAQAEALARLPGPALDRLRTWLALAEIAREAGKTEDARRCAREALNIYESELKKSRISPWHLWQLSRATARSAEETEKAKELAESIGDPVLKGRAQLEIFSLRLEGAKGRAEPPSEVSEKKSLAYGLALEAIARHNTRTGAGVEDFGVGESDDPLRPFVLLGEAAGSQQAKR